MKMLVESWKLLAKQAHAEARAIERSPKKTPFGGTDYWAITRAAELRASGKAYNACAKTLEERLRPPENGVKLEKP